MRKEQQIYILHNRKTGEVKYFASLVAISSYLGKSKSWGSYISLHKDGKYKDYEILRGDNNDND